MEFLREKGYMNKSKMPLWWLLTNTKLFQLLIIIDTLILFFPLNEIINLSLVFYHLWQILLIINVISIPPVTSFCFRGGGGGFHFVFVGKIHIT